MLKATPLPDILAQRYRDWRASRFEAQRSEYLHLAREGQSPQVMIISCCDSRVLVSEMFQAEAGDYFVHRNIAALVPPYGAPGTFHGTLSTIQYAVETLEVRHILVVGHSGCGGVAACHDMSHGAPARLSSAMPQHQPTGDPPATNPTAGTSRDTSGAGASGDTLGRGAPTLASGASPLDPAHASSALTPARDASADEQAACDTVGGAATFLAGAARDAHRTSAPEGTDYVAAWLQILAPCVEQIRHLPDRPARLGALEREGILLSLRNLMDLPFVRARVMAGSLEVHGAWKNIGGHELEIFDPIRGFVPLPV